MSEENVEIVRKAIALLNRGDVDRALEPFSQDFLMDWSNSIGPAKGIYRGIEEIREVWRWFAEAFDVLRWTPEEIIDVDEARLIVINHVHIRGRGSGAAADAIGAQLWTFEQGVPVGIKLYQSKAEALEAAGLRE
jgi:ketosteroid isomerase-like protein